MASQPEDTSGHCSACGRFTGPADECPYCGCPAGRLVSWKALRIASLVLALAGVGLLYAASLHREAPVVAVKDIVPSMNYAYVRVAGLVVGEMKTGRRSGAVDYVSFRVDDGTGEITVTAYDARARRIVEEGLPLKTGAEVEAAGSLGVRTSGRSVLYVEAPGQIRILAPAP